MEKHDRAETALREALDEMMRQAIAANDPSLIRQPDGTFKFGVPNK